MNRPYLTPRDLADATGDHGAIGEPPLRHVDADDFDPPPSWWTIAAAFVVFVCSCMVWRL